VIRVGKLCMRTPPSRCPSTLVWRGGEGTEGMRTPPWGNCEERDLGKADGFDPTSGLGACQTGSAEVFKRASEGKAPIGLVLASLGGERGV